MVISPLVHLIPHLFLMEYLQQLTFDVEAKIPIAYFLDLFLIG